MLTLRVLEMAENVDSLLPHKEGHPDPPKPGWPSAGLG